MEAETLPCLPQRVPIGLHYPAATSELHKAVTQARESGHDFIVIPISHSPFKRFLFDEEAKNENDNELLKTMEKWRAGQPFSRDDLLLKSAHFVEITVGTLSDWIDLDSSIPRIRINSEIALKQELAWAAHLGLSTVLIPYPSQSCFNYARSIHTILAGFTYTNILMRVPLTHSDGSTWENNDTASWERWNRFRTLCEHHGKLCIALELTADLPEDYLLERWYGEPVKSVIVPTHIFLTNAKGYPVLSKRHQTFVRKLMRLKASFIISDTENLIHSTTGESSNYQEYLRHMNRTMPELTEVEKFATGYQDYLQSPLQPLMDNLESATYETFEKDPIKYFQYEKAIYHALLDRVPPESKEITVIMVVGAGRGPLVNRSLEAAEKAKRGVRVYAIEKNPNAFVTLQNMKAEIWGDKVTIVFSDMRQWKAPEKADIFVSELLGSFGDNELSPECLDGAQKFLKDDGISIPANYTAYVAPLSSSKLYTEVAAYKDLAHFETPYVVMFQTVAQLAEPKKVWEFQHPNKSIILDDHENPITNYHNTRYSKNTFTIQNCAILHGIAGYFESVLYKNITLSIHPRTHSPGMFSWFPIFFPLKTPILLPENSKLDIHFWRLTDLRK
ncbi:hypothetical protein G9A89_011915 [Geosiphon pyriformis]|nr:hypothetical protein G9A89_011915 [Geosiphon pyriformis]